VLFIEHDMELVVSGSPSASRCWSTAGCSPRARRPKIAADPRVRDVYLGETASGKLG